MDEPISMNDLDREAAELEALALRLSLTLRRSLQQYLDAFNLTLPQYTAMSILGRGERGCSMSALADASQQLSPTMTGIVDRLVERGLVTRTRDPNDRRTLLVELSPEGRRVMERITEQKRVWMRRFLQVMSADEREMVSVVLLRFLEVIEGLPAAAEMNP